ncbi:hypothetical protein SVIO_052430 [Streptomyces violaceusniger]|uniref:Uncharacterized protein n=1 Tax=Streptomyces violaceusniger TaxID=68280 RepID=A0A4D4L6I3_STRVO|nr:hypothetical protein SVIO_052430 [Streptomyces violaceusniger]
MADELLTGLDGVPERLVDEQLLTSGQLHRHDGRASVRQVLERAIETRAAAREGKAYQCAIHPGLRIVIKGIGRHYQSSFSDE